MLKKMEFVQRCTSRGLDEEAVARAVSAVEGLENALLQSSTSIEEASLADIERHIDASVKAGACTEDALMAMARYFAVTGNESSAIRLLAYVLPIEVLPAMAGRLRMLAGDGVASRVLEGLASPQPGAPPEAYPVVAGHFVKALVRELGEDGAERVLAWNVHGIPASAFVGERDRLAALGSIEAWLRDYHERQVRILSRHAEDGTLWFEQKITAPVVEFVRTHPEVQGGVRDGELIYVTKIPYDPDTYLKSSDPLEKRRLACHCPLAASSITRTGAGVPAAWCACSAGFVKFMFDVVFGQETQARVVSSVLAGDDTCRFAIRIPEAAR
jgi:hypothetical protein